MRKANGCFVTLGIAVLMLGIFGLTGFAAEKGGVIRIAIAGDPPTLDGQISTSNLTGTVTQHIYECLLAFDEHLVPQPMLADSYEVQDNGLTYVFHLRKGVLFHNGKEMQAEDVVASLERWIKVSSRGAQAGTAVKRIVAKDPYTVVIHLSRPYSELPTFLALANAGAFIMPKEIVEAAGEKPVTEYIGTGPYRFVEWDMGNYVLLKRFEDYKPRPEPASRKAGARIAYADELKFVVVPEESTRVAGVLTGEYDVAMEVSYDKYESLKADPRVAVVRVPGMLAPVFFFNHKQGIMTDLTMRQAVLAALDMERIMQGTVGNKDLYFLGPNFSFSKDSVFYSEAGAEYYNQANPAKARELLKEAGYNNEPIRWIAPAGYPVIYWSTVIAVQQLIEAGFNIKFTLFDAGTFFSTVRPDPAKWDIFSTYHGWVASPALWTLMSPSYPGWWENETKDRLFSQYLAATDIRERAKIWSQIQQVIWEDAAVARCGTADGFLVASPKLKGLQGLLQPVLWNVWIER